MQESVGTDKAGETEKIEQKNVVDKSMSYPVKNDRKASKVSTYQDSLLVIKYNTHNELNNKPALIYAYFKNWVTQMYQ